MNQESSVPQGTRTGRLRFHTISILILGLFLCCCHPLLVSAGWNPASSTGFSLTDATLPYPCPVATPSPAPQSPMRYVDGTHGSDTNDGLTTSTAWKTIQRSVSSSASPPTPAGATVQVRAGVYSEMVTVSIGGASSGPLLLQSYPGEVATIDGTSITVPAYDSAGITVSVANVIVAGFEVRNFHTTSTNSVPAGIRVTAANVTVINNYIHHISNDGTTSSANAHGLAVYAATNTEATALTGIVLAGNEIAYNILGQSETLVINGNVEGYQIVQNFIHDNNNIGIDAVGFEGTSTNAALDQARGGLIQGNVVYNITAATNPGYGGSLGADGIYLDGATTTRVDHNIVFQCDIGIEMASEHSGRSTSNSSMTNNIVYQSNMQGLSVGGYSAAVGFSSNITIANNVAWNDDTTNAGSGELVFQYHPTLVQVTNNVFVASAQGVFTSSPLASGTGNSFDYNTYLTSSSSSTNGISLAYNTQTYTTFTAWKTATGFDSHSTLTEGTTVPLCGTTTGVQCVNGVPILIGYTTAIGAPSNTCPSLTPASSSSTGGSGSGSAGSSGSSTQTGSSSTSTSGSATSISSTSSPSPSSSSSSSTANAGGASSSSTGTASSASYLSTSSVGILLIVLVTVVGMCSA